jgi:hypothetical protein
MPKPDKTLTMLELARVVNDTIMLGIGSPGEPVRIVGDAGVDDARSAHYSDGALWISFEEEL